MEAAAAPKADLPRVLRWLGAVGSRWQRSCVRAPRLGVVGMEVFFPGVERGGHVGKSYGGDEMLQLALDLAGL